MSRIDRARLLKIGAAGVLATNLRLNSPAVAITSPAAGSTVSGTIPVTASYSGPGFRLASLSVDGTQVASLSTQPIAFSLDTSRYPDGTHTLGVRVEYRKANQFHWTEASLQLGIRTAPIQTPAVAGASTQRWYSNNASVNTPIPPNPAISPYNATIMANFTPQGAADFNNYFLGPRDFKDCVAYPPSGTANVTVQVNGDAVRGAYFVSVPIPSGTTLANNNGGYGTTNNNENYMVVMMADGTEWDLYGVTPPNTAPYPWVLPVAPSSLWQALGAEVHTPGWTDVGYSTPGTYGTDSGLFEGYGIIRYRDIQNTPTGGNWDHALNWTGFANCAAGNLSGFPVNVAPANRGDGTKTVAGCFPEGMRMQLDPSINIDTWPSLSGALEWQKQMCRTLQVYGMINAHDNGNGAGQGDGDGFRIEASQNLPAGTKYPWQDSAGAWPYAYSSSLNVPSDLLSHFRVLDWTVPIGS